jgi:FKBP-type peptidyl-prolyl cis-trans isomerase SlyD
MNSTSSNPTHIHPPCVASLTWVLTDASGEDLDTLETPIEFLVGGLDLLPTMNDALRGKKVGDTVKLALEPDQAFGDYDEKKIFLEQRAHFDKDVQEGDLFHGSSLPKSCSAEIPRNAVYAVANLYPEHVVLDANHPLAGIGLRITLKIHALREPRVDEVGCGSSGTGFFKFEAIAASFEDTTAGSQQYSKLLH